MKFMEIGELILSLLGRLVARDYFESSLFVLQKADQNHCTYCLGQKRAAGQQRHPPLTSHFGLLEQRPALHGGTTLSRAAFSLSHS